MSAPIEEAFGWYWAAGFTEHARRYLRGGLALQRFLSTLPDSYTGSAVQAGGHAGVFPAILASRFDAVYTFEPDAANFAALVTNTAASGNVFAARGVLGSDRGPCSLRINRKNSGGHHVGPGPGPVPVYRVDDLGLGDCHVLVLDCEGGELRAVRGARDTIERCRPWILVELRGHAEKKTHDGTDDDVRDEIRARGYEFAGSLGHDEVYKPCNS